MEPAGIKIYLDDKIYLNYVLSAGAIGVPADTEIKTE